ncbi:MAG: hypothetical protein NTW50_00650 [Candidatus Berkelbacteria bacterium]|nr:hypothetical protein [Candidatus Berkelbacteria bacterium]
MESKTKIEKMIENLAISTAKGFADQSKVIEDLAISTAKGFADQSKVIEDLAISTAKGFADQNERFEKRFNKLENINVGFEKRFDRLENDNIWIKNVLENHSTILERLDQERIFTINHVNRLEDEINEIKKQLKIA